MYRVVVNSAFIPSEGKWVITKVEKGYMLNWLNTLQESGYKIEVFSQHQTVKILGLNPAKDRLVYTPEEGDMQVWVKPKGRLDFGREYTLKELEEIGYDIYVAQPQE